MYALSLQCDFWMILQLYCRFFHSPVSFDFPGDSGFSFIFFCFCYSASTQINLRWGQLLNRLFRPWRDAYFILLPNGGAIRCIETLKAQVTPSEAWYAHAWQSQLFTPGHFDEETDFNYGIDFFVAFLFWNTSDSVKQHFCAQSDQNLRTIDGFELPPWQLLCQNEIYLILFEPSPALQCLSLSLDMHRHTGMRWHELFTALGRGWRLKYVVSSQLGAHITIQNRFLSGVIIHPIDLHSRY